MAYDVGQIWANGWTTANTAALAADLVCLVVPVATGGGPTARVAIAGGEAANAAVHIPAGARASQGGLKLLQATAGRGNRYGSAGQGDNPQEDAVRDELSKAGYEQPFGTRDKDMAAKLGAKGEKFPDIIGVNKQGRWAIVESKGSDIESAFAQLQNGYNTLLKNGYNVKGNTSFGIVTNRETFERMANDANGSMGYKIRDGYLGWFDETRNWVDALIDGEKILVEGAW